MTRTISLLSIACLMACTADTSVSKDEARLAASMGDTTDFCADEGWYGDGECDAFCVDPDPDCDEAACVLGDETSGCFPGDCGEGQTCDLSMTQSSGCVCQDSATGPVWTCTPDVAGTCVDNGEPACDVGDTVEGCFEGECGEGQVCDLSMEQSSSCVCQDSSTGPVWNCTPDLAGTCVDEEDAADCVVGEESVGCFPGECGEGEACDESMTRPSACVCQDSSSGPQWNCTPDIAGTCVPE